MLAEPRNVLVEKLGVSSHVHTHLNKDRAMSDEVAADTRLTHYLINNMAVLSNGFRDMRSSLEGT
jgi:hypothetical protein